MLDRLARHFSGYVQVRRIWLYGGGLVLAAWVANFLGILQQVQP